MEKSAITYADFAEFERRQRGIERHLLAAFLGGLLVGLLGMLTAGLGPGWFGHVYDPYAYLALALAVGATASGFGWALLTTFLAAVSTLVAAMGGSALRGKADFDVIGGSAAGLNWMLALLVGIGLLAYVTRRSDRWGDYAAGVIGAAVLADIVDRATPGFIGNERSFWPLPAVVIGAVAVVTVIALRRSTGARVRALACAVVLAGLFAAGLAASLGGWITIAV
ncbi:hypothetical protein [Nonomuraea sp. LPB2021202275-12-8]|uniref:hypothetical protein n=1 Tax=Nonomuraea sp. LPB2021202275-12-8 TaxID=3120159 RepID=UPI00300C43B5